jgi:hypothetical protein
MKKIAKKNFIAIIILISIMIISCDIINIEIDLPDEELPFYLTDKIIQEATRYKDWTYDYQGGTRMGMPYLLGGQDTIETAEAELFAGGIPGWDFGIDCSGFVINVYKRVCYEQGFSLPFLDTNSSSMYAYYTNPIDTKALRESDLVFFRDKADGVIKHVAIATQAITDENPTLKVIHAESYYGKVVVTEYDPSITRGFTFVWFKGKSWEFLFGRLHIIKE